MSKKAEEIAKQLYPESSGPMERSIFEDRRVSLACGRACEEGYEQAEKDILSKAEELIAVAIKKYDEGGDRFWLGARFAAIEIRDMIKGK